MIRAVTTRRAHRRTSGGVRFGRNVVAASLCLLGMVLAAAFVGITVQANALEREKAGYRADIAAAQAEYAARTAQIELQNTADYVREKARDFGYIGANESLIAIQRDGQASDALSRAVREGPSRIARWFAFFFGTR
jgi:cell division protein FtsB